MKIKIFDKNMPNPNFATKGSVGMDLRASTFNGNSVGTFTIKAGETVSIGTGVAIDQSSIGDTCGALLLPRSGLGTKHGLQLANTVGLIDTDYHGEIIAAVKNTSSRDYVMTQYDRIAQICFVSFIKPVALEIVDNFDVAQEFKERGSNGFGSTGTK